MGALSYRGQLRPHRQRSRHRGQLRPHRQKSDAGDNYARAGKGPLARACGAKCEGSAKSVARANTLAMRAGTPSIRLAGVRTHSSITRPILVRGHKPTRSTHARVEVHLVIRVHVGWARPSSRPKASPRPRMRRHALPRAPPLAYTSTAAHRHGPGAADPARRPRHHLSQRICQRCRSCQRSLHPAAEQRPSRSSARQLRAPTRIGCRVAAYHVAPLIMASILHQPAAMSMSMSSLHRYSPYRAARPAPCPMRRVR